MLDLHSTFLTKKQQNKLGTNMHVKLRCSKGCVWVLLGRGVLWALGEPITNSSAHYLQNGSFCSVWGPSAPILSTSCSSLCDTSTFSTLVPCWVLNIIKSIIEKGLSIVVLQWSVRAPSTQVKFTPSGPMDLCMSSSLKNSLISPFSLKNFNWSSPCHGLWDLRYFADDLTFGESAFSLP